MDVKLLFSLNFFSCFFMLGLILLIQLVHYPSFSYINNQEFLNFSRFHQTRITPIVAPIMILELITSTLCYLENPTTLFLISFILTVLTWLSTFFLSVPLHGKLLQKKSKTLISKLIITNWPRTIFWILRSALLLYIVNNEGVL